jgi:hypothetical protein
MSTQIAEWLDVVAKILLRCWMFGFLLLVFWFAAVMLAGDFVYYVHGSLFDLSRHELQVIHYCGMGLVKLTVGVFFFFPWAAIRLVLRRPKALTT